MSEVSTRRQIEESIGARHVVSKRWQRAFFGLAVVAGIATTHTVMNNVDTLAKIVEYSAETGAVGGAITERLLAARRQSSLVGQYAASQGVDYSPGGNMTGRVLDVAHTLPTILAATSGKPFSSLGLLQALPMEAVAIGLHVISNEMGGSASPYVRQLDEIDHLAAPIAS